MPNKYPYIIHGCPNVPAYPTHTHGLTEIGMPEFIIDPLAFGAIGNMHCINAVYKFFKKRKNTGKLKAILNGKTIKLSAKALSPKHPGNEAHTYCFREVSPEFEAVKQAYLIPGTKLMPGMRFIQIYIDGDDFALMDEYYRGGVTW